MGQRYFSRHEDNWRTDAQFATAYTVDHVNKQIFRSFGAGETHKIPREIFKLRYDVYCVEREFLSPDDAVDGLERDDFDDCSTHIGAYTMEEALVGTVRLVRPPWRRGFPFVPHCSPFADIILPPHEECGEISRLVVKRTHRRRRADSVLGIPGFQGNGTTVHGPLLQAESERRDRSPMLLLGMYRELFRVSRSHGVRFWFAAMERALARSLAKLGFPVAPIGPVADYYGAVTLYLFDLAALLARLEQENPALGAWFSEKPSLLLPAASPCHAPAASPA